MPSLLTSPVSVSRLVAVIEGSNRVGRTLSLAALWLSLSWWPSSVLTLAPPLSSVAKRLWKVLASDFVCVAAEALFTSARGREAGAPTSVGLIEGSFFVIVSLECTEIDDTENTIPPSVTTASSVTSSDCLADCLVLVGLEGDLRDGS